MIWFNLYRAHVHRISKAGSTTLIPMKSYIKVVTDSKFQKCMFLLISESVAVSSSLETLYRFFSSRILGSTKLILKPAIKQDTEPVLSSPYCKLTLRRTYSLFNQLHAAESLLRSWWTLRWSRNSPSFMEAECWLPSSQEPAIGPFPKPLQNTSYFNIILPSTPSTSRLSRPFILSKYCVHFVSPSHLRPSYLIPLK
jgi:hypothetical protein